MTTEELFYARLCTITANVWPMEAPEGATLPLMVYQSIVKTPTRDLDGTDGSASSLMQVDVYSQSLREAKQLGSDLITSMNEWTGVASAAVSSIRDGIDKTGETRVYRQTIEIIIFA